MSVLPASQNKRRTLYRNLMVGALVLLVACAFASRVFGVPMHLPSALIVIGVGVLSLLQFNALDEVAKQAHYVAWYWGGLLALAAMGFLTGVIAVAPQAFGAIEGLMRDWFGKADAQTSFLLGLITTPTLMMLGFAGWWAVYWLRRR